MFKNLSGEDLGKIVGMSFLMIFCVLIIYPLMKQSIDDKNVILEEPVYKNGNIIELKLNKQKVIVLRYLYPNDGIGSFSIPMYLCRNNYGTEIYVREFEILRKVEE